MKLSYLLNSLFFACLTAADQSTTTKLVCTTKFGTNGPTSPSTTYLSPVTKTSKTTSFTTSTVYTQTVTPRASTLSSTTTATVTNTRTVTNQATSTSTPTSTQYATATTTVTQTNTVTTNDSTTITSTPTSLISTSSGFIPVASGAGFPGYKRRDTLPKRAPSKVRGFKFQRRDATPTAVTCKQSVTIITTATSTKTTSKATTIATPTVYKYTTTVTQIASATTVSTVTITGAATTATLTSTTSTVTDLESTTVTSTSTSTETAATVTQYAACQSNNVLNTVNGGRLIRQLALGDNTSGYAIRNSIFTPYDCCAQCQQISNCVGSTFFDDGTDPDGDRMTECDIYYNNNNVCDPQQVFGMFGDNGPINPFYTSNGNCGQQLYTSEDIE